MNPQAAIEAARIAAETAARNAWITTIVTVITLLFTSGISIWSVMRNSKITKELGEKNLKALEQRRYIDAISVERIKWINEMREKSSEFLKVTHLQSNDFLRWRNADIKEIKQDMLMERSAEIASLCNQINLLLNPTDFISKELIVLQNEVSVLLSNSKLSEFDFEKLKEKIIDIGYLYQVIIRTEWKRIKEENKDGTELSEERMNKLYFNTAKKIDDEHFNKLFNKNREKVPN